mgnify:FL=1
MSSASLEERVAALEQLVTSMHCRISTAEEGAVPREAAVPAPPGATETSGGDGASTPEWLRCAARIVDTTVASAQRDGVRPSSPPHLSGTQRVVEAQAVARAATSAAKPKGDIFGRRIPGMPW